MPINKSDRELLLVVGGVIALCIAVVLYVLLVDAPKYDKFKHDCEAKGGVAVMQNRVESICVKPIRFAV